MHAFGTARLNRATSGAAAAFVPHQQGHEGPHCMPAMLLLIALAPIPRTAHIESSTGQRNCFASIPFICNGHNRDWMLCEMMTVTAANSMPAQTPPKIPNQEFMHTCMRAEGWDAMMGWDGMGCHACMHMSHLHDGWDAIACHGHKMMMWHVHACVPTRCK
jgi:hypothetical protein